MRLDIPEFEIDGLGQHITGHAVFDLTEEGAELVSLTVGRLVLNRYQVDDAAEGHVSYSEGKVAEEYPFDEFGADDKCDEIREGV